MIPTIEQICDDLKMGNISLDQSVKWLLIHQELSHDNGR